MKKKNSKKCSVGIDIGSVSINCIVIDRRKNILFESAYRRHFGNIWVEMTTLIEKLFENPVLPVPGLSSISRQNVWQPLFMKAVGKYLKIISMKF